MASDIEDEKEALLLRPKEEKINICFNQIIYD
jgi:hypothetical protein